MRGLGNGQVWWADLDKVRPVLVLTRSTVADQLHRVLVAPITTTVRDIPVEVALGSAEGLVDGSVANLDNVQLVPVDRLLQRAGTLHPVRWPEVCAAMGHTIGCAEGLPD
jgi:mRNA interferase MazF